MKKTIIQHASHATSRRAWARLAPELLEKARRHVKVLAWLSLDARSTTRQRNHRRDRWGRH